MTGHGLACFFGLYWVERAVSAVRFKLDSPAVNRRDRKVHGKNWVLQSRAQVAWIWSRRCWKSKTIPNHQRVARHNSDGLATRWWFVTRPGSGRERSKVHQSTTGRPWTAKWARCATSFAWIPRQHWQVRLRQRRLRNACGGVQTSTVTSRCAMLKEATSAGRRLRDCEEQSYSNFFGTKKKARPTGRDMSWYVVMIWQRLIMVTRGSPPGTSTVTSRCSIVQRGAAVDVPGRSEAASAGRRLCAKLRRIKEEAPAIAR